MRGRKGEGGRGTELEREGGERDCVLTWADGAATAL
jgi:hypothetical protein